MELWDLYTADRVPTGEVIERGRPIPAGLFHLGIHAWIRNSEGKYLISQRSPNKDVLPLMWETVAGSVLSGESSLDGALREVYEEVGLKFSPDDAKLVYSVTGREVCGHNIQEILDVYLFEYDGNIDLSSATTDEVVDAKWLTCEEISQLKKADKLVYILDYFFDGRLE